MIFSIICAIIQISLWWIYQFADFNKIKIGNFIKKSMKLLIDSLPFILLIYYHTPLAIFFLIGCFISDRFLGGVSVVGAILFIITYGITSIFVIMNYDFKIIYWVLSILFIFMVMVVIFSLLKCKIIKKIAEGFYGFTALVLCLVAFCHTHNIGFLGLVIGDIIYVVSDIFKQNDSKYYNVVKSISNSFYFIGLCFVPLSLI